MDLVVDAMAKLFSVITGKTPRFKVSLVAGSLESVLCPLCKPPCLEPAVHQPSDEQAFGSRLLESLALVPHKMESFQVKLCVTAPAHSPPFQGLDRLP